MFGVYTDRPRRVYAAFADLGSVAELVLAYPERRELAKHLPADLLAAYVEHGPFPAHKFRGNRRSYPAPPATALTAAVGAVIGMQILGQPNVAAAGREMRWLLRRLRPCGPAVRGRSTIDTRPHTTDALGEVHKKALGPLASPSDQLHYRRGTDFPSAPAIPPAAYDRIVHSIRSELWPDWAVRITPRKSSYAVPAALACAILLVGSNASVPDTVADLGSVISPLTANRILVQLSRTRQWKAISTAILRLSNYLAERPAPINYTRRRAIDYTDLLPPSQWYEICRDADTRHGADQNLWCARYYLYEMLSGKPARTFPHSPTSTIPYHRGGSFTLSLTSDLLERLDDVAQCFLSDRSIDEPIMWQPPLALLDGLPLAGVDPTHIDLARLHRLARKPGSTVNGIAERAGSTPAAVRLLLTKHPVGKQHRESQRLHRSNAVRSELTAQTLDGLFHGQRMSIGAIGRKFGVSNSLVRKIAAEQAISLQRVDLSAAPEILRPALERQCGWLRLERFAASVDFPSILAAGRALGAPHHLNAEIHILEHELGGRLLNRSAGGGKQMELTPFGNQVLQAVYDWLGTRA